MIIIWCYGSWDMEGDRHNFLSFWTVFALLPPCGPRKSKLSKNGKNTWRHYHFTNINDSDMMYGSSDMECNGQNFLSFWTVFCPFTPNNPKNQDFEKMKKLSGNIIILHRCNVNDNHMMYGSWDGKGNRQNFLSFQAIFCPFIPPNNPKNQNLKTRKNT